MLVRGPSRVRRSAAARLFLQSSREESGTARTTSRLVEGTFGKKDGKAKLYLRKGGLIDTATKAFYITVKGEGGRRKENKKGGERGRGGSGSFLQSPEAANLGA